MITRSERAQPNAEESQELNKQIKYERLIAAAKGTVTLLQHTPFRLRV